MFRIILFLIFSFLRFDFLQADPPADVDLAQASLVKFNASSHKNITKTKNSKIKKLLIVPATGVAGGLFFIEFNTLGQKIFARLPAAFMNIPVSTSKLLFTYLPISVEALTTFPLYAGQLHDVANHVWQLVRHPRRTLEALKETDTQHPYLLTALKGLTTIYAAYKGLQRGQLNYDAWQEAFCEPYDYKGAALTACNNSLTSSQMWPVIAGYPFSATAFAVSKFKLSYPAYEYVFTEAMRLARFRNPLEKKRSLLLQKSQDYFSYIRALKADKGADEIQAIYSSLFADPTQQSGDLLINFQSALASKSIPTVNKHWTRHATQTAGWLISSLAIPAQYGIWQGMGHSGVMAGILTGLGYIPEATSTSFMLETFYEGITKRRYLMEDYGSAKLSLLSWGVGTFLALPFFVDGWVSTTVDQTTPFMMVSLASYLLSNGAIYGEVVRDQYKKISRSALFQKSTRAVKGLFTRLFCCKKPDHRKITLETERKKVKAMRQEILDKLRNEVTRIRKLKDDLLNNLYNAFTGGKEMQDVARDPESPGSYTPPKPVKASEKESGYMADIENAVEDVETLQRLSASPLSSDLNAPLLQRSEAPAEESTGYAWYNPIGWYKAVVDTCTRPRRSTATAMPVANMA